MEELILLGAGPSAGLPQLGHVLAMIAGKDVCSVCKAIWEAPHKAERRCNVSALIRTKEACILIDMGKTTRQAFLAQARSLDIQCIDTVLLTHDHADAVGGLDDLREFKCFRRGAAISVIGSGHTLNNVRQYFPWIVPRPHEAVKTNVGRAKFQSFESMVGGSNLRAGSLITIHGLDIYLIPVHHGADYLCYGFVFGNHSGKILYLSDVAWIPQESIEAIDALGPYRVLVIDSLTFDQPQYSHCCVEEILHFVNRWRPAKTYIVGFSCGTSLEEGNSRLKVKTQKMRQGLPYSGEYLINTMCQGINDRPARQQRLLDSIPLPHWRPLSASIESIELAVDGTIVDLGAQGGCERP